MWVIWGNNRFVGKVSKESVVSLFHFIFSCNSICHICFLIEIIVAFVFRAVEILQVNSIRIWPIRLNCKYSLNYSTVLAVYFLSPIIKTRRGKPNLVSQFHDWKWLLILAKLCVQWQGVSWYFYNASMGELYF